MDPAATTAVAGVISAGIAGVVGYLTSRTASKAQVQAAQVTTRADVEKEAFERAEKYYGAAMDRQEAEIRRQDAELAEVRTELSQVRSDLADARAENDDLKHELALTKDDVRHLAAELAARGEA